MRHIESYFIYRFHMCARVCVVKNICCVWYFQAVAMETQYERIHKNMTYHEYERKKRQWCYVFKALCRKKDRQNGVEHMSRIKMFNLNKIQNIYFFKHCNSLNIQWRSPDMRKANTLTEKSERDECGNEELRSMRVWEHQEANTNNRILIIQWASSRTFKHIN